MNPHDLPVYKQKDRILDALSANQVVVVESPTGSGKTTQIPLILHEAGYSKTGMIGVTQPRRIAAVSVCDYIARQLNTEVPGVVGYKMRFEDKTDFSTRIKIMTDGILLQEIKADKELSRYNVMLIDEAHERSLNIDFILGILKSIVARRPDFKVIISSATINAEVFSEYFDECPIVRIEAGAFPVQVIYDAQHSEEEPEWLLLKIEEIVQRVIDERREGDILIFLSGEQTIKDCMTILAALPAAKRLELVPLYGRLGKEEQERVFLPTPRNKIKVVVATNIAETSVTIDGITTVIDSGLSKVNYYNPKTFISSLVEGPISKASCNQRKGRAGRTQPGICYRLYTKKDYESRPLFTTEEIYRTDLSEVVLRMAELDITDFETFDFISPPADRGISGAIETLRLLDALTEENTLSEIGKLMVEYPLLPRLSRMIVEAIRRYPNVLEETITAAAFLSTNSPFILPPDEEVEARRAHHAFQDAAGDFVSYLKLLDAYLNARDKERFCTSYYLDPKTLAELANVKEQLEEITGEIGIPISSGGPASDYLCAISRGLIQFVCVSTAPGVYRSLTADKIHIHPGSVMFRETPRYIVAGEIVKTSRMFARSVSPLEKGWLERISPELSGRLLGVAKPARGEREPAAGERPERKVAAKRDTTWQVTIGRESFELLPFRGKKKVAVLPWERLAPLVRELADTNLERYEGLRGKIVYQGRELFSGERLTTILRAARFVNPDRGIRRDTQKGKNYDITKDLPELCESLTDILALCPGKKREAAFGFLCLHTEGHGVYWFRCAANFGMVVSVSLASLETLADELVEDTDERYVQQVNAAYRRLSELYEA